MPNLITINNDKNQQLFSGKLILTNFGRLRVLSRISQGINFDGFHFSDIGIGSGMNSTYSYNISQLKEELAKFPITNDNIFIQDNMATIETNINLDGEVLMQEIGLFETINNEKVLFAYASGFSMIKNENVTYKLIVDLNLNLLFENEHYKNFDVSLDDTEYALMPDIQAMFKSLAHFQLNLERCVEINARELGYHRAQLYMLEQKKISNTLRNILLLGRYEKIIKRIGLEYVTDCFFYPSDKPLNYSVVNLKDSVMNKYTDINQNEYLLVEEVAGGRYFIDNEGVHYPYAELNNMVGFYLDNGSFINLQKLDLSVITVTDKLQLCNRDNINLSGPASIVFNAQLNTMSKENVIFGKMNPLADEYYFDFREIFNKERSEYGLQFTIYCYDSKNALLNKYSDERKLVGHYRITYFPTEQEKVHMIKNETMFTFVYNGDINNPKILMYIGTKRVNDSENFIVDNFNYFGPNSQFKNSCTLRNYSQTIPTNYEKPQYYVIPEINTSSIVAFNKELTEDDIYYLALISQS